VPTPYLAAMLAESRAAEQRQEARTARLAAIARCSRPSAWVLTARRITEATTRLLAALRRDWAAVACCAA
jgi:hypothetical protein